MAIKEIVIIKQKERTLGAWINIFDSNRKCTIKTFYNEYGVLLYTFYDYSVLMNR